MGQQCCCTTQQKTENQELNYDSSENILRDQKKFKLKEIRNQLNSIKQQYEKCDVFDKYTEYFQINPEIKLSDFQNRGNLAQKYFSEKELKLIIRCLSNNIIDNKDIIIEPYEESSYQQKFQQEQENNHNNDSISIEIKPIQESVQENTQLKEIEQQQQYSELIKQSHEEKNQSSQDQQKNKEDDIIIKSTSISEIQNQLLKEEVNNNIIKQSQQDQTIKQTNIDYDLQNELALKNYDNKIDKIYENSASQQSDQNGSQQSDLNQPPSQDNNLKLQQVSQLNIPSDKHYFSNIECVGDDDLQQSSIFQVKKLKISEKNNQLSQENDLKEDQSSHKTKRSQQSYESCIKTSLLYKESNKHKSTIKKQKPKVQFNEDHFNQEIKRNSFSIQNIQKNNDEINQTGAKNIQTKQQNSLSKQNLNSQIKPQQTLIRRSLQNNQIKPQQILIRRSSQNNQIKPMPNFSRQNSLTSISLTQIKQPSTQNQQQSTSLEKNKQKK